MILKILPNELSHAPHFTLKLVEFSVTPMDWRDGKTVWLKNANSELKNDYFLYTLN